MMSEPSTIIKFELLPNEILFECFKYFNAIDIFYSFDRLNNHLDKLIRDIPLFINFENISQLVFNEFCTKILSNQDIKKNIYSLNLSNKDISWQSNLFLTHFSLNEFVNLRSLTLTEITSCDISLLESRLLSIPQLFCFRLIDCRDNRNLVVSKLHMPGLKKLILPHIFRDSELIYDISSIISLTIVSCTLQELCKMLNNVYRIKYLKVESVESNGSTMTDNDESSSFNPTIHLKELILMSIRGEFSNFIMILKQTPNLKSLTINACFEKDIHHAGQWEDFITSSLPYLKTFKFNFRYVILNEDDSIEKNFKQFQNDFWHKQHHWYTEYEISKNSSSIYTIPYILNTYYLNSYISRCINLWVNNYDTFENVTKLTIDSRCGTNNCQYYFSHISFLELGNSSRYAAYRTLGIQELESMKMIINLTNITHLCILDSIEMRTSFVLLKILREMQKISSITISSIKLISLFNDDQLCKYLNKMIKRLTMNHFRDSILNDPDQARTFCKIFSNLEQLTCTNNQKQFWLLMIKHLPKLTRLNVRWSIYAFPNDRWWLEKEVDKLNLKIFIDRVCGCQNSINLSIWIIRDIF